MSSSSFECQYMSPEQSVIVMKGHPFTRKTELAKIVAKSIGCPVLSSEDFLRFLTPPLSPKQEDEAFQVICQIAIQNLNSGLLKNVVIDSPISSEYHFLHLINRLSESYKIRVIVIECKPTNTYSWKLKFQHHLARRQSRYDDEESQYDDEESQYDDEVKWYKPQKWEDVEKAIQQHPDYDVISTASRSFTFVSKLVVDPISDCPFVRSLSGDETYIGTHSFLEAVKYMMTRDRGEDPDVVVYHQWLQKHLSPSSSSSSSTLGEEHCSTHGHDIVPNSTAVVEQEGIQVEAVVCMACERQVIRSNDIGHEYCYCRNCSLTLHMECALSCKGDYAKRFFAHGINSWKQSVACIECQCQSKNFSFNCRTCELQFRRINHRSENFRPIAIKHFDTKEHFLTMLFEGDNGVYRCAACGKTSSTKAMYLCKDCGVAYHYVCVTLPPRLKNVHGGHHHHMSLKFESEEEEDYLCQECQELRDPSLWYYSCGDCPGYELHPSCVAKLTYVYNDDPHPSHTDKKEIRSAEFLAYDLRSMERFKSISNYYLKVIYLIQWYGQLRDEFGLVEKILGALPLKFYHIVVAIKRSEEYKSMTVDQLMIYLRVYEKRIDNGEDVLIEQVLANLYAAQRSSSIDKSYREKYWYKYYGGEDDKLIMNAEDVSLHSVLRTDYSTQESGENWVKYWGKYWDNYWFNYYQRGYYSSQDKSKVQCSICYMFGHDSGDCWSIFNKAKKKPLKIKIKIKIKIKRHSSQRFFITKFPATVSPSSDIEGRVLKD